MVRRWGLVIVAAVMLTALAFAQEQEKAKAAAPEGGSFYKLNLTVREMDGNKILNSRSFDLSGRANEWSRIRVGTRVPSGTNFVDLGLNADFRIMEVDGAPFASWTIDLSSAAAETAPNGQPVIRNVRSQGYSLLTLGKPTVLSSSDDLNSAHKFVFEVTATRVK